MIRMTHFRQSRKGQVGPLDYVDLLLLISMFAIMLLFFILLGVIGKQANVNMESQYSLSTAAYATETFIRRPVAINGEQMRISEALALSESVGAQEGLRILSDIKKEGDVFLAGYDKKRCSIMVMQRNGAWVLEDTYRAAYGDTCGELSVKFDNFKDLLKSAAVEEFISIIVPTQSTAATGAIKTVKIVVIPELDADQIAAIAGYGTRQCTAGGNSP